MSGRKTYDCSGPSKFNDLRFRGCSVKNSDGSVLVPNCERLESHANGAACSRRDARATRSAAVQTELPLQEMDEIDNVLAPLFVRITACGLLVVLRSCGENLTGVIGEKPTTPVLRRTLTWLKR